MNAIVIELELTPQTRTEIYLRVVQEPGIPTPNEPDVSRGPLVTEWRDITDRLRKLDRLVVKRAVWPVP